MTRRAPISDEESRALRWLMLWGDSASRALIALIDQLRRRVAEQAEQLRSLRATIASEPGGQGTGAGVVPPPLGEPAGSPTPAYLGTLAIAYCRAKVAADAAFEEQLRKDRERQNRGERLVWDAPAHDAAKRHELLLWERVVQTLEEGGENLAEIPGICIGCGCTELAACAGGCGWSDETRLLCTTCAERMAAAEQQLGEVVAGAR